MSPRRFRASAAHAERRERVIARYRAAYERANGVECPELRYESGWVVGFSGGSRDRVRVAELERMAGVLECRADGDFRDDR